MNNDIGKDIGDVKAEVHQINENLAELEGLKELLLKRGHCGLVLLILGMRNSAGNFAFDCIGSS